MDESIGGAPLARGGGAWESGSGGGGGGGGASGGGARKGTHAQQTLGEPLVGPKKPPPGGWKKPPTDWNLYPPVEAMKAAHKKIHGEHGDMPEGCKGECLRNIYAQCRFTATRCDYYHSDTKLTDAEKVEVINEAVRQWELGELDYGNEGDGGN